MTLEGSSSSICSRVLIAVVNACVVKISKSKLYFFKNMKLLLFFIVCSVNWCFGVRLNPLENNDKLQDISNQYVAEWQWESWPIKQEPSDQDIRSPGPRTNAALWRDSSGPAWYLFGGQPVDIKSNKIYSDVWKYSTKTRVWERFFPSQSEIKGTNIAKIGGMMTLRANLFDEGHTLNTKPRNYNIILCGGVTKRNSTKPKKQDVWSNFTRRKKQEEEEVKDEPKSLAIYAPKSLKSNTVWQIDLKDKLWTAYVCCCDTTTNKKENSTFKPPKLLDNFNKFKMDAVAKMGKLQKSKNVDKNESSVIDLKIDKTEDEVDNEQQHLNITSLKNKKKKINQSKKISENLYKKTKIEKRESEKTNQTKTETLIVESKNVENKTVKLLDVKNQTKVDSKTKKEKFSLKLKEMKNKTESTEQGSKKESKSEKFEKVDKPKVTSQYCPEFSEDGEPVTWCDGNNEVLITADISLPQITLWIFNLRTSHWSQQKVKVSEDIDWPGCSTKNPVRYAGNEEEVYLICSLPETQEIGSNETLGNMTNPSKNPSEDSFNTKVIYRINYKRQFLESLGEIQLPSFFNSPEGLDIWQNESKLVMQVIRTPENDTLLLMAYLDNVDLWMLNKNQRGREYFDLVEKIWRGSALKWFSKYNAALYNLQFVSDSGKSETFLIFNPRFIELNEYWPRERGRFIIRIFKNENLKNQSFENKTREQNLTYELLQSDFKPPAIENQINHTYSLKVLVFFGISLAIFTVFGFVIFLKRCVTCPPRIRVRNECHKSPLVIRYSVIPDDLLYPVA